MLRNLKTGKSKDPYCLPNELFKPDVAGDVTMLINRIKNERIYPEPMELCNVTNLYKNKGQRSLFNSYRGIFRTPVLRNILDKLMYNDEYEELDTNLTDANVGCKKQIYEGQHICNECNNE